MQIFSRETTDHIAQQFCAYFERKKPHGMNVRDARKLIDFVSGPVPSGGVGETIDYSKLHVTGGGKPRPSESEIEGVLRKYIKEDPYAAEWDEVFDELLKKCNGNPEVLAFVHMRFRDNVTEPGICEELHIGRTTYYGYQRAILSRAGLIAVKKELLNP